MDGRINFSLVKRWTAQGKLDFTYDTTEAGPPLVVISSGFLPQDTLDTCRGIKTLTQ